MNRSLSPISLSLLLTFLLYSTTTTTLAALSPLGAPVQPAAPAPPTQAPTTPLVPTLPQSPSDSTPDTHAVDIVGILRKANNFNVFIRLMKTTQLVNTLNSQLITIKSGGLTILAADDSAFSELKPGFLNTLSDGQKLELLQFHVLSDYVSSSNFDTLTNPVRTLAGSKPGKVELDVISYGGSVNVSTGAVNTTITGIIYSDKHLAIYKVGKVLLPLDFFPTKIAAAPKLAPAPAVEVAKAPKPDKEKPLDDSSESSTSQVVPAVTSGVTARVGKCGTLVSLAVGIVFAVMLTT